MRKKEAELSERYLEEVLRVYRGMRAMGVEQGQLESLGRSLSQLPRNALSWHQNRAGEADADDLAAILGTEGERTQEDIDRRRKLREEEDFD